MKYVMFYCEELDVYFPIIFPNNLVHDQVAQYIGELINKTIEKEFKPSSAGTIDIMEVNTYGSSSTLKLKSIEQDSRIIEEFNYLHGIGYE